MRLSTPKKSTSCSKPRPSITLEDTSPTNESRLEWLKSQVVVHLGIGHKQSFQQPPKRRLNVSCMNVSTSGPSLHSRETSDYTPGSSNGLIKFLPDAFFTHVSRVALAMLKTSLGRLISCRSFWFLWFPHVSALVPTKENAVCGFLFCVAVSKIQVLPTFSEFPPFGHQRFDL